MLQARELTFSYDTRRGRVRVVDGVSLDVARGSIVGLLGPNGAGKTTLLRLFTGMLRPEHGVVLLDGAPLGSYRRRDRARRIAVVPQETHTAFDVSVLDMVLMGRYPHLGPFALEGADDLAVARDALAATGMSAFETRPFATLSGGEKQRVVIASAVAQASDMLLLDEPTAALDLRYQIEIGALLRRLNAERGTTMIISTHDLNFAASICGHVAFLQNGRVMASGATAETVTADALRSLYGIDADVQFHARAGHLTVVPLGRA